MNLKNAICKQRSPFRLLYYRTSEPRQPRQRLWCWWLSASFLALNAILQNLALTVLSPDMALAAEVDKGRQSIQDSYREYRRDDQSLFATAPLEHVIPQRNMVTLGVAYNRLNLNLAPEGDSVDKQLSSDYTYRQRLQMTGWDVSPLVAFSAKNFGIGFAGEYGVKSATFTTETQYQDYFSTSNESKLSFSGIGMNVYYIPNLGFLPKFVTSTLILGSKTLFAIHEYRSGSFDIGASEFYKYKYSVRKSTAGINVGLHLAKRFTVFPWVNFNTAKVTSAEATSRNHQIDPEVLALDQELFWHMDPLYTYGVDFAFTLGKLDIHLGGALGMLGSLTKVHDNISDDSLSISLGYSFKAD